MREFYEMTFSLSTGDSRIVEPAPDGDASTNDSRVLKQPLG